MWSKFSDKLGINQNLKWPRPPGASKELLSVLLGRVQAELTSQKSILCLVDFSVVCFASMIQLLASIQKLVQQCYLHYTRLFTPKQIKPHNCTAQSIPEYDQTHYHISNPDSSDGLNYSHNPKPKDLSVTECVVKASHTSVIAMCFKENVASIEVNRMRGYSRLRALTRPWREAREKTLWNAIASQWTLAGDGTKYGMHYGSDRVEDEDTNKHINPP